MLCEMMRIRVQKDLRLSQRAVWENSGNGWHKTGGLIPPVSVILEARKENILSFLRPEAWDRAKER